MNVALSEEQELLARTADALAARSAPTSVASIGGPADTTGWKLLADAGLLGLRARDRNAAPPASGVELMLIVESLARHLSPLPFLGQAALAGELLALAGAASELQERLAAGQLRVAVGFDPTLERVARAGESGALAFDAAGADAFVVFGDDRRLRTVAAGGPVPGQGDLTRRMVEIPADATPLDLGDLGGPIDAEGMQRWQALALALLSADLVGVMQGALDAAVSYSRDRIQYGQPIGSFQAVQHLCAESYVLVEASRSATWFASWAADARPVAVALDAARTAKCYAAESAVTVVQNSIQVHGGIAITWETFPHLFLRRALLSRRLLGDDIDLVDRLSAERLREPT